MKKFKFLLAASLVFSLVGCGSQNTEKKEEAPQAEAIYTVYNKTGEKVTSLTNGEVGQDAEEYAKDGMNDGDVVVVNIKAPEAETKDKVYVLTYVTESGRTEKFETLHFEEAPITLLSKDAMTGATVIAFEVPKETAAYTIYNKTGEKATVTITDNKSGEELYSKELEADASDTYSLELTADKTKECEYTLKYVTASGRTEEFKTLHFEKAPITLLAKDAMTGATPIEFKAAQ